MIRRSALAAVLLGAPALFAHDAFRIIGVVTKKQDRMMQVRNKAGKIFSIEINKATVVLRDKNKLAMSELKAGLTVVVDALGDSEEDLAAVEVRIVPPLAPAQ